MNLPGVQGLLHEGIEAHLAVLRGERPALARAREILTAPLTPSEANDVTPPPTVSPIADDGAAASGSE